VSMAVALVCKGPSVAFPTWRALLIFTCQDLSNVPKPPAPRRFCDQSRSLIIVI
jgi:hypothetical protein